MAQLETSFKLSSNNFEKEYNPVSVFRIQASDSSNGQRKRRHVAKVAAVLFDRSMFGLWRRYSRSSGLDSQNALRSWNERWMGIHQTK
jgi:hypothetical protein